MNRKLKIGLLFLLATLLLTGIYADDEFGELRPFLKYRPSFQFYYHSPLGMQDSPPNYPMELALEEAAYDEFINEEHWSDNDFLATGICGVLYLGTTYLLISGIIKQFQHGQ